MTTLRARQALASRSEGACGSGNPGDTPDYNVGLHIAATFIVLLVSTTACAFPLIITRVPKLRLPSLFLFMARHFGTGVLVATAFVHLLPTAFISLTNPCLPKFWSQDYPAMAGAIALAAVFLVIIITMVFSPGQHVCAMPIHVRTELEPRTRPHASPKPAGPEQTPNPPSQSPTRSTASCPGGTLDIARSPGDQFRNLGPLRGRATSVGRELQRMGKEVDRLDMIETLATRRPSMKVAKSVPEETDNSANASHEFDVHPLTPEQKKRKAFLQCILLELGILFHSVFIGMALSVSVGADFVVLLIAITFHRELLFLLNPLPRNAYEFSVYTPQIPA